MSLSNNHPTRSVTLSSLPEELLERILEDCITSTLSSQSPGSTYATSPYPSPNGSPPVSPSSSGQGFSPSEAKHPAARVNSPPRPPFHPRAAAQPGTAIPPPGSTRSVSVVTPLVVSRLFHRISSPLLYRSITLSSRSRSQKLLQGSLRHHPERAGWIRRLVIAGVWEETEEILRLIASAKGAHGPRGAVGMTSGLGTADAGGGKGKGRQAAVDRSEGWATAGLEVLEVTIDAAIPTVRHRQAGELAMSMDSRHGGHLPPQDGDAEALCDGLKALAEGKGTVSLKELVVRKPQNAYLTHARTKKVLGALARVVESAPSLSTAYIAFRLSDDPVSQAPPGPTQSDRPIAALTQALSLSPCLRSVATHLPSVWNEAVLRMSQNPALERIVLLGVGGMPVTFNKDSEAASHGAISVATSSRSLPPHPLDRVYTTSARGCDGYALAGSNRGPQPGLVPGMPAVPGTGVFMKQAQKHERLCALVHAGYLVEAQKAFLGSSSSKPLVPSRSDYSDSLSRPCSASSVVHAGAHPRFHTARGSLSLSSLS